jgi:hypothetical protein
MRRGGIARFAVWIALGSIGAAWLANCSDFGGDIPTLLGGADAALVDRSIDSPGVPSDVLASAEQGNDGAAFGGGASSAGSGNGSGGGGDDSSGGNLTPNDSGSVQPPSGVTEADADMGFDSGLDETGVLDAVGAVVVDAGVDVGTPEAAAPEAAAPDAAADSGGSDAGALDTGGADADASSHDAGTDTGIADSATPDAGGDSGTDSGAGHGCDPNDPLATTHTCFVAQNQPGTTPSCVDCATANSCFDPTAGGGTCEMLSTTLTHLSGSLPDGKTCSAVLGSEPVSEKKVCMQTLKLIFSSKCAATMQLTPCLCGTTDPTTCQAGSVTPNGPVYDEYACDMNSTSGMTLNSGFINPTFGAGVANVIAECAGAFGCPCF